VAPPTDPARQLTFLFADLAGFTALTEAHGDERAAVLATEFCGRMRERAAEAGAEVVKTIGDAAMIRSERAGAAIALGLRILDSEGSRAEFPAVRVGMNSGPAVETGGDWFGATVNIAARVAALAAAGEVVLTQATFDLAGGALEGVRFERLGSRVLKNVSEPVVLLRASREGVVAGTVIVDPVCRMTLAEGEWIGSLAFEGEVFHFCSMGCARRFSADPESYARHASGDSA
jgi:class 3 adenylate cyclase/YHS domain-containing protein